MRTRKPDHALTLHDRLSHLTFAAACKLIGARGAQLIRQGGQLAIEPLAPVSRDAKRTS